MQNEVELQGQKKQDQRNFVLKKKTICKKERRHSDHWNSLSEAGTKTLGQGTRTPDSGTSTPDASTKTAGVGSKTADGSSKTSDARTKTLGEGTKTADVGTKTPPGLQTRVLRLQARVQYSVPKTPVARTRKTAGGASTTARGC